MNRTELHSYIANLPIGDMLLADGVSPQTAAIGAVDINQLPDGIVTGSNLIQFPAGTKPELKSSVALSLLAAQRVASNSQDVGSPSDWVTKHNDVLKNLNWRLESGGVVKSEFKNVNVAVHEAIIPFLTAAFGGAALAGSLILKALEQLKEMDKNSSWITLFDRQSRRFGVTEYQFSIVEVVGETVHLNIAAARLDAAFGKTQVLFFKLNNQKAAFEQATQRYAADAKLLEDMNGDLQNKLRALTKTYIQGLPDDLLLGAEVGE